MSTVNPKLREDMSATNITRITATLNPMVVQAPSSAKTPRRPRSPPRDMVTMNRQKAPNVHKAISEGNNLERYFQGRARERAVKALPLAFPPIRLRRGESVDDYIDSTQKPWEEKKAGMTSEMARRQSAHPSTVCFTSAGAEADAERMKHDPKYMHPLSVLWRQLHQSKGDLLAADEASASTLQPMMEACDAAIIASEREMVAAMSVGCRDGVCTTSRGVIVPYAWFGEVNKRVIAAIDSAFTGHYKFDGMVLLPPPGHPARHSFVAVKCAVGVSMMWRMLEQVKTLVPGMETALQIFTEVLVPLIYVDFQKISSFIPMMASLSDQYKQLLTLPLASVELQRSEANEEQLAEDVTYTTQAMENWSFQLWKQHQSVERRKNTFLIQVESIFQRRSRVRTLEVTMLRWKNFIHASKTASIVERMEKEYAAFITTTRNAAAAILPKGIARTVHSAKMVAERLIETATHNHPVTLTPQAKLMRAISPMGSNLAPPPAAAASASSRASAKPLALEAATPPSSSGNQTPITQIVSSSGRGDFRLLESTLGLTTTLPGGNPSGVTHEKAISVFTDILDRLKLAEEVSGHLREQSAIQTKRIQQLDLEKKVLDEKIVSLEKKALKLVDDKLKLENLLQLQEVHNRDRQRKIIRLKSRVRLNRHRDWRKASMRMVASVLGVSSLAQESAAEAALDAHLRAQFTDEIDEDDGGNASGPENGDKGFAAALDLTEEEKMYGRLAPLAVAAPHTLPDPHVILRDWVNHCLDDLQTLDGQGGGVLSVRVSSFGQEVRDSVLLSRLLFYLALPRYRTISSNNTVEDVSNDCKENRRRLVQQRGVLIQPPFPTYDDCFSDIHRMPFAKRAQLMLTFAAEIVATERQAGLDESILTKLWTTAADVMATPAEVTNRTSDLLLQIVDPVQVADGARSAIITFMALLYVRFSHPLNHKAKSTIEHEKDIMIALMSDARATLEGSQNSENSTSDAPFESSGLFEKRRKFSSSSTVMASSISPAIGGTPDESGSSAATKRTSFTSPLVTTTDATIYATLVSDLEDEEKTPWQIFLEKCQPMLCSDAHGFVLTGQFWSWRAFEKSELVEVVTAIALSLNNSLNAHRWHVILSCLAPVATTIGLGRGVFVGPYANSSRYLAQRQAEDPIMLDEDLLLQLNQQRINAAAAKEHRKSQDLMYESNQDSPVGSLSIRDPPSELRGDSAKSHRSQSNPQLEIKEAVLKQLRPYLGELTSVFLTRGVLRASNCSVVMTLGGWRKLWLDTRVCPEKLTIDAISQIYVDCNLGVRKKMFEVSQNSASSGSPSAQNLSSSPPPLPSFTPHDASVGLASADPSTQLLQREMIFDDFLEGFIRIAHYRYSPITAIGFPRGANNGDEAAMSLSSSPLAPPPSSPLQKSKGATFVSLADAVGRLLQEYLPSVIDPQAPQTVAYNDIIRGVDAQSVLLKHNMELTAIFHAYAKNVFGVTAMEKDDVFKLAKEAQIASGDVNLQLLQDLYHSCSSKRSAVDCNVQQTMQEAPIAALQQTTMGASAGGGGPTSGGGANGVTERTPNHTPTQAPLLPVGQQKIPEKSVLTLEGFGRFIVALALCKLPNPFTSVSDRLEMFMEKLLLPPLRKKLELNRAQRERSIAPSAGGGGGVTMTTSAGSGGGEQFSSAPSFKGNVRGTKRQK